ncbi:hypothetical protein EMEDMD4_180121 [Sinorhizobium medicae]|uniref:Uncharacterized protein n=1 Tax=Sinorhizobium medicae TaxID=110321 RepID=A0A508WU05_9HYPH|nr:hypothetical protein EMEDMD4_180121 [Sinorhizobium medicae]
MTAISVRAPACNTCGKSGFCSKSLTVNPVGTCCSELFFSATRCICCARPHSCAGGTAMVPWPHIYHSRVLINAQGPGFVSHEIEINTCETIDIHFGREVRSRRTYGCARRIRR